MVYCFLAYGCEVCGDPGPLCIGVVWRRDVVVVVDPRVFLVLGGLHYFDLSLHVILAILLQTHDTPQIQE
jgi:hypothetical protein